MKASVIVLDFWQNPAVSFAFIEKMGLKPRRSTTAFY